MIKRLPQQASIEHLRKQAKSLLKSVKQGKPIALQRISEYFTDASEFNLSDSQLVLAREYGFPSWRRLKDEVDPKDGEKASESDADRFIEVVLARALELQTSEIRIIRRENMMRVQFRADDEYIDAWGPPIYLWERIVASLCKKFGVNNPAESTTSFQSPAGAKAQLKMLNPDSEDLLYVLVSH